MLIKPGSSRGAMWLFGYMLEGDEGETLSSDAVTLKLNGLCPEGWAFRENDGQWGLWDDTGTKTYTHGLLYSERCPKMVEVKLDG